MKQRNPYLVEPVIGRGFEEELKEEAQVSVGTQYDGYLFAVENIDCNRHGGNILTVTGTVAYVGFPKVLAKLWKRSDGRWFLGINHAHLVDLEETEGHLPERDIRFRLQEAIAGIQ